MTGEKTAAEAIGLQDLDMVTGGTGITERTASLLRSWTKSDGSGTANGMASVSTGIAGAQAAGNQTADAGTTVMAYCPKCGIKTEFSVFSGARGVCRACGEIRNDL